MNNLIVVDTREKGHKKILEYFDEVKQDYIPSKLEAADYMIFKDYSILIDRKDNIEEVCKNLCNKKEHQRVVREIERAKLLGCKRFIFLIQSPKLPNKNEAKYKDLNDVCKFWSPYTKIKGITLYKIMKTFMEHHDCEFLFATQETMAQTIIDILNKK